MRVTCTTDSTISFDEHLKALQPGNRIVLLSVSCTRWLMLNAVNRTAPTWRALWRAACGLTDDVEGCASWHSKPCFFWTSGLRMHCGDLSISSTELIGKIETIQSAPVALSRLSSQ
jgi:hypothetical protein